MQGFSALVVAPLVSAKFLEIPTLIIRKETEHVSAALTVLLCKSYVHSIRDIG